MIFTMYIIHSVCLCVCVCVCVCVRVYMVCLCMCVCVLVCICVCVCVLLVRIIHMEWMCALTGASLSKDMGWEEVGVVIDSEL